jgi:hypothetical protein
VPQRFELGLQHAPQALVQLKGQAVAKQPHAGHAVCHVAGSWCGGGAAAARRRRGGGAAAARGWVRIGAPLG